MRALRPRSGCVKLVDNDGHGGHVSYALTEVGYALILEKAGIGSSVSEIADALRVSHTWLKERLDEDNARFDEMAWQAFMEGVTAHRADLRVAQKDLAKVNAPMAIWLGRQALGQREQVDVVIDQTIRVVGATPDYEQTPEAWQKHFAPAGTAPPVKTIIDVNATEIERVASEEPPPQLEIEQFRQARKDVDHAE